MNNLTEVSIALRKFVIWFGVVFVVYIILKFLFGLALSYLKETHVVQIPAPDVRFNKLPSPQFSSVATSSSGLKFTLENVEGHPPEATTAGKVYALPKKLPTLLSADRAKKFAAKLGFTKDPQLLTSTYYRYTDPNDHFRTLSLDTVNMHFQLKYDYTQNPRIFDDGQLQSKEQAEAQVKNFLTAGIFDETILKGKLISHLLTYDAVTKTLIPATSVSTAKAVRVDFFRSDLDGLKVLPPRFDQSYISVLYVPTKLTGSQIFEVNYIFWPIASDDFATYPLRTGSQAWQDLIDGYAYVVDMGGNTASSTIIVRNIYLAYYDSEESQSFLQPVFVFEGDKHFIAFVPAVSAEWLE